MALDQNFTMMFNSIGKTNDLIFKDLVNSKLNFDKV